EGDISGFHHLAQRMIVMPGHKRSEDDAFERRLEFLLALDVQPVLVGGGSSVITLNAIEVDVEYRETIRDNMGENYRTLLGHFRHEIGHYYFALMQHLHPELIEEFRHYFGDERQNYSEALQTYYNDGAPINWQENYISAYATAHPWEDWA